VPIVSHLDRLLLDRQMTLTELAERVGVTIVNLSILKTNKARAVRFSTLEAICRELDCQPATCWPTCPPRSRPPGRWRRRCSRGSGW
jgi:putative transcriptional regulator